MLKPRWRQTFSTLAQTRRFSNSPIDLKFHLEVPPPTNYGPVDITRSPLIILHGLFGWSRNWRTLSKDLARELETAVYVLDLRNHGHSPHVKPHNYLAMAEDVRRYIHVRNLRDPVVLGHSMGGKVAMTLALSSPERVKKLILADIAPVVHQGEREFEGYIKAMLEIEKAKVKTMREAMILLSRWEKDISIQMFLLTNLEIPNPVALRENPALHARFRIPLGILAEAIPAMFDFPFRPENGMQYTGPTLFIRGTKSNHITEEMTGTTQAFFPQMKMRDIDTGHWVHAERPMEFKQLVLDFLLKKSKAQS